MDGKTHRAVGAGSGFVVALVRSEGQDGWKRFVEGLGGGVGGYLGACAPDVLEPAVHSWHRSGCHSVTAGASVVLGAKRAVGAWEKKCRKMADDFETKRQAPGANDFHKALYLIIEVLLRMAAGVLSGAATGYVSHLALDAVTPRGIPLICR